MKLGFLVNPIAGMGGKVGLKGTDDVHEKAVALGAEPVAPGAATDFLKSMTCLDDVEILTCGGAMGSDFFTASVEIVHQFADEPTAEDTKLAVEKFVAGNVDLIVFCGGDGTARDVAGASGSVPVLGVPGGVKMYSSVFAIGPKNAARVVCEFFNGSIGLANTEIVDVDEVEFRKGNLDFKLFGTAQTPFDDRYIQRSKSPSSASDMEFASAIADHLVEEMMPYVLYIICPGLIKSEIMKMLDVADTPLGIDAVLDGKLAGVDLNEIGLLELLALHKNARIVVTPIGAQGFVFGRGNQQVSDKVIAAVGDENVIVVATPQKLAATPRLFVQTGNNDIDKALAGYRKILNGYRNFEMRQVEVV